MTRVDLHRVVDRAREAASAGRPPSLVVCGDKGGAVVLSL